MKISGDDFKAPADCTARDEVVKKIPPNFGHLSIAPFTEASCLMVYYYPNLEGCVGQVLNVNIQEWQLIPPAGSKPVFL